MAADLNKKNALLDEKLGQIFTITEKNDEFTGIDEKTILSDPLFTTPFFDENLELVDMDKLSSDGKNGDDVVAEVLEKFNAPFHYSRALPHLLGDNYEKLPRIDETLTLKLTGEALGKFYFDESDNINDYVAKNLVPRRKEILLDAAAFVERELYEEAKKLGKLQCRLIEIMTTGEPNIRCLMFSITSAAIIRNYPDIKALVITASGKRISFDLSRFDADNEQTEIFFIPIKHLLEDYLHDKYDVYFPFSAENIRLNTCTDHFVCTLSEDQRDDILAGGTRISVRFDGYDIRGEFGDHTEFINNAFRYLSGDYSLSEELLEYMEERQKFMDKYLDCEKEDTSSVQEEEVTEGRIDYPEGSYYIGGIRGGKRHGKGILYLKNGSKFYEGEFFNGEKHGIGIYYWENGNTMYEGHVVNGKWHGVGREYSIDGTKEYEGEYIDGKRCDQPRPLPKTQNTTKQGCYVATAVYGSYDCPEVWILRRFRDTVLDETWIGRLFIKLYYAISPTLVKWFGKTRSFYILLKHPLDIFIGYLKVHGFKDTPYKDKY